MKLPLFTENNRVQRSCLHDVSISKLYDNNLPIPINNSCLVYLYRIVCLYLRCDPPSSPVPNRMERHMCEWQILEYRFLTNTFTAAAQTLRQLDCNATNKLVFYLTKGFP